MHQDEPGRLRHSIRGCLNALKLGTSALDTGLTVEETLEFLDYFEQAAEKMMTLLDQFDALPPTVAMATLPIEAAPIRVVPVADVPAGSIPERHP